MTDHRWTPSDIELTDALRVHYAAPSDPSYWAVLEARILAHVARGGYVEGWWSALLVSLIVTVVSYILNGLIGDRD